ncbi:MAG: T9SS type A sorting domain-containing protein [Bacteroidales bacterium]|nr:T9SS type A sorting domain-containing protein [Bacteroidales bacterium]
MKQLFKTLAMLFFVCVLFTNKLNAQITLEHTFEERVYITYFEGGYWNYIYPDDGSYLTITIYNSDYSLYKQVTFYPCEGYTRVSPECRVISTEIIMVGNYLEGSSNCDYWLYDSNGDIIKYWGYNTYASAEVIPGNKLYVFCLDRETGQEYTEIYSIDSYESTSEKTIRSFSHAYPNPAKSTISLPYNLNKGEQAEMLIYDVNGRMIDKKRIDSTFNKILLNVESYTPGVYFYSVNGVSQKFVVK